jgi:hypothetical protein
MRIPNKYNRNRHFRIKHWKRIRRLENPYEYTHGAWFWTTEEQIIRNFESIAKRARALEAGDTRYSWEAPSAFRRSINKDNKAQVRHAMARINMGDYDYEVPHFKRDAAWLYW